MFLWDSGSSFADFTIVWLLVDIHARSKKRQLRPVTASVAYWFTLNGYGRRIMYRNGERSVVIET